MLGRKPGNLDQDKATLMVTSVEDVPGPSFTHEIMDYDAFESDPGQFEVGVGIDY